MILFVYGPKVSETCYVKIYFCMVSSLPAPPLNAHFDVEFHLASHTKKINFALSVTTFNFCYFCTGANLTLF